MVGRPTRIVWRPFRIARSGRETHPEGQEWSGGHPKLPGVVGMSSRKAVSCREDILEGREWSGGPPGVPGVFWRPSWRVRRPSQRVKKPSHKAGNG